MTQGIVERLEELEALCEKATKGPWESDTTPGIGDCRFDAYAVTGGDGEVVCDTLNSFVELHEDADEDGVSRWDERGRKNMEFIAASREALPWALKQLRAQMDVIEAAKKISDGHGQIIVNGRVECRQFGVYCDLCKALTALASAEAGEKT